MASIGLFYGSSSGNVEFVAKKIQECLGEDEVDIFDIAKHPENELANFEKIILGSSTWGDGELQDDWQNWIIDLEKADLSGKSIALFGLGDQEKYSDTFANAVFQIYEVVKKKDCTLIGRWQEDNYSYKGTESLVDGLWLGLVIDEDNQSDLTDERIQRWCAQLRTEWSL